MNMNDFFSLSISRLNRNLMKMVDIKLSEHGLTTCQLFTMIAIDEMRGPTPTNLAHALEADRTTITRGLDPLIRDGLVTRQVDVEDRRLRCIELTAKGKRTLDMARSALEAADKEMSILWIKCNMKALEDIMSKTPDAQEPKMLTPSEQLKASVEYFLPLARRTKVRGKK